MLAILLISTTTNARLRSPAAGSLESVGDQTSSTLGGFTVKDTSGQAFSGIKSVRLCLPVPAGQAFEASVNLKNQINSSDKSRLHRVVVSNHLSDEGAVTSLDTNGAVIDLGNSPKTLRISGTVPSNTPQGGCFTLSNGSATRVPSAATATEISPMDY